MSAAGVDFASIRDAHDESATLDRFLQLRAWLRGLGVCWCCSMAFAIRQVDRETGGEPSEDQKCFSPKQACRDIARSAWKSMPPATTNGRAA